MNCVWPHPTLSGAFDKPFVNNAIKIRRLQIKCSEDQKTYNNRSLSLIDGVFRPFINLEHLSLDSCQFDFLPENLTIGLTNLKSLNLRALGGRVRFHKFPFPDLYSLEKLTIVESNFDNRKLWENVCKLKNVKFLNLSRNLLENLSKISCQVLKQAIILDLSENRLNRLDFLINLNNLRILRLSNNNLINPILSDMPSLIELYLNGNRIRKFDTLPQKLKILDLSQNDINVVDLNKSENNLEILNLSRNHLNIANLNILEKLISLDLSHLKELLVNDNKISKLKKSGFDGLQNLQTLNLANNRLSSLDDDFFTSSLNVKSLDLSKNFLQDIPTCLFIATNLEYLDLSNNHVTKIPKFLLKKLSNLKILILNQNRLNRLDDELFEKLTKLSILDLSSNFLEISPNFGKATAKILLLQNNSLTKFDSTSVAGMRNLEILNLSKNSISTIDIDHFSSNLREFYVSENDLNFAPKFGQNFNFRILDFSGNKISTLASENLPDKIEVVNFSHNLITKIDNQTLYNKTSLKSLNLSDNNLNYLDKEALTIKNFTKRPKIMISGNPFRCSCRLKWIRSSRYQMINFPEIIDYDRLTCQHNYQTDQSLNFINRLNDTDFLCPYKTFCIDSCPCCDFDICDCKNICPSDQCQCFHDNGKILSINLVKCTSFDLRSSKIENFCRDNNFKLKASKFLKNLPLHATTLYLDGGNLCKLYKNSFFSRYRLKFLFLNRSNIVEISPQAFNVLSSLEFLDLSQNELETLNGDEFANLGRLEILRLNSNRLRRLGKEFLENLPNLKVLSLNDNRLKVLPTFFSSPELKLTTLTFSQNPWKCDCNDRYDLQSWLPKNRHLITDSHQIYCFENLSSTTIPENDDDDANSTILKLLPPTTGISLTMVKVNFWTFKNEIEPNFCRNGGKTIASISNTTKISDSRKLGIVDNDTSKETWLLVLISISICLIILTLAILVGFIHRKRNNAESILAKNRLIFEDKNPQLENNCLLNFKIFLIYSKLDEKFVLEKMLEKLENFYPYYHQIGLLHKEYPNLHKIDSNQLIGDLRRNFLNLFVVSENFLKDHYLINFYKKCLSDNDNNTNNNHCNILHIIIDRNIKPNLHRTDRSGLLYFEDEFFWSNLHAFVEQDVAQNSGSEELASSSAYGSIVPSLFV
uniref:Toll-like receptor n=1 Tax=Romanomermis culicivorax TaxID=13658 RepID=A0A915I9L4_ROMCU